MSAENELPTFSMRGMGSGLPNRLTIEYGHGRPSDNAATEDHLVALLEALPDEQLKRVVDGLSDERKQALAAAIDWPDERLEYERSRQELCERALTAESALTAERARRIEAERVLGDAIELIREYEAQWGSDYLAQKWDLKGQREAIEAVARGVKPEPACCECGMVGQHKLQCSRREDGGQVKLTVTLDADSPKSASGGAVKP